MPKAKKQKRSSALEKARQLFVRNGISDTEGSDDSEKSQEYSHIPLRSGIPSLANFFLEEEEDKMDQVTVQLQQISEQLASLTTKQAQYERDLRAIKNNISDTSDSEEEEDVRDLGPVNSQNIMESLSRIPDPIKSIPTFDGNPKQLSAWIISAENILKMFKPLVPTNVFKIYEQSVIHKLQGKAKDAICMAQYPQTFEEAKKILTTALGDRQELSSYKSKLWRNKQTDSMSVHKYYQKTQYLVDRIKTLAKQDKDYAESWPAISKFIDQDALAAFIAGLNEFYFGHALAARPKSLEDAYTFLCEFTSSEKIARGEKKNENVSRQPRDHQHKKDNNKFYKPNSTKNDKSTVEPMEVETTRSRLTLNKNVINNHEAECSESENEDTEPEELDLNFQMVSKYLETS